MVVGGFTLADWFVLVQHELLLFAALLVNAMANVGDLFEVPDQRPEFVAVGARVRGEDQNHRQFLVAW